MSSRGGVALLDVNVLVALFDPDHIHHDVAHDWFADHRRFGWATCPLTESGFLRTASQLARARDPLPVSTLTQGLRTFTSSSEHQFWSEGLSFLDERLFDLTLARGDQQLTDIYLLALAVRRKGVLATFDQKIPIDTVKGAQREHVTVLAPVN
jgi:toxin-antitoxin system PIN domain toxin